MATKAEQLAEGLLRERAERTERERQRQRRRERAETDFDPFNVAAWIVIAGGDSGYLPKTPMRRGKEGFVINCRACGKKFDSKGLAYCSACMALPADERHGMVPSGRECAAPGCTKVIAPTARADAVYCSAACKQRAHRDVSRNENGLQAPDIGEPKNVTDSSEKNEQNQRPKNNPDESGAYERLQEGRPVSRWEPTGDGKDMPDIPDFLKR